MYSAKSLGRNQTYVFAEPEDDAGVLRAPISPAGRARAEQIGLAARERVLSSLAAVISDLPGDRGRPSPVAVAIATSMAIALELPEPEIDRIRVATLLRDIGKVAVPTEILTKSTALTSSEWRAIVQHPRIAQVILEQATALREAVPLILHHHERFAGHGYPFGLRGDEIPLGARIVAIADAYDSMTSDRPYKRAIGHEAAIRELRRHAGTQFDPALVRLFCELFSFSAPAPDPDSVRLLATPRDIPSAVSPELARPARPLVVATTSRPVIAKQPVAHPSAASRRAGNGHSTLRGHSAAAAPGPRPAGRPAASRPKPDAGPVSSRAKPTPPSATPPSATQPRPRPVVAPSPAPGAATNGSKRAAAATDATPNDRPTTDRRVAVSAPKDGSPAGTRRRRALDAPEAAAG
jgi:hypothetical protein